MKNTLISTEERDSVNINLEKHHVSDCMRQRQYILQITPKQTYERDYINLKNNMSLIETGQCCQQITHYHQLKKEAVLLLTKKKHIFIT